jgi:hypothetical protein
VPDHFIGEEIASEVAHHLMHFDDHFRFWAFRNATGSTYGSTIVHCSVQ